MLNNVEQTGEYIWKFVHGLQTTNFKNRPITDDEANASRGEQRQNAKEAVRENQCRSNLKSQLSHL